MQAQSIQDGLAAWGKIHAVLSHPRCTNCHVGDSGRPAWDDLGYGRDRLHGMNINAGESRIGAESIPCRACHIGTAGSNDTPHMAPRVDDAWRLPPVSLAWRGKTSLEICESLSHAEEGAEISDLIEHVEQSEFVRYGFEPGQGRNAAPASISQLVAYLKVWGRAGMPCKGE
ncbi:hypothetical protein Z948_731 [Sulfitobacter donghicola DSW-25 = KCTC 12864 = JCM 14565]|nr:hypothetical protein Z948_731 [Sulfitobacter donghicola DSW-25 = KCTC 12864 = JCM 14565]